MQFNLIENSNVIYLFMLVEIDKYEITS